MYFEYVYSEAAALVLFLAVVFSLLERSTDRNDHPHNQKTHLKPFLNLLETSFKYLIRPVPVVFRRLAF
jgi:hypothetical protein